MPKFCFSVLFLCILLTGACQQPVLQWAKVFKASNIFNYSSYSNGRTIAVDPQGNVYSAGLLEHTVDFDPGHGGYKLTGGGPLEYGIYISKLSPTGEFIWAKQIPVVIDYGYIEMKVDKNGNLYLTSDFYNTADMDPGPGVQFLTPIGKKDAFILKLDTNGNLLWVKQFGGTGDTLPFGSALDIDQDGNVIVCGSFNRTVDFDPGPNTFNLTSTGNFEAFITKLNSDGDFIWAKKLGNYNSIYSSIYIADVKCDPSGNICCTGLFAGDCDFDPGVANYNLVAGGPSDGFISKLDANGNFVWAKKIGNSALNHVVQPIGIDIDSKNNIITTGTFIGTQDFDPGTSVYNVSSNGGTFDSYILKLNEKGDFLWVKAIGGTGHDYGADLAIDNDDNIYAVGNFDGSIDFDPGPGVFLINGLHSSAALTKFNSSGSFIYAAAFANVGAYSSNLGRRMVIDAAKYIYITGYLSGTTDFDPGPGVYSLSGNSDMSPFVLKLSRCNNITAATLDISTCNSYTLNNTTFDSSGIYTQVIPNSSGCDSIITLNLTINKKSIIQTKIICEGEFFFAGGVNQHTSGTYKDTLLTLTGCDSIVTTHLMVNLKPFPNLGPDKDLCKGTQLTVTPGSFVSYLWQDGSTKNTFNIATSGLFWVTVTNSFNCSATDSMAINVILPNPANFLKTTDSICSYDKLSLQPFNNFSSYLWSTGDTKNNIIIEIPGKYWLTVTDSKGCNGTDSITVFPKECISGIFIPTAFTPNGDGKNDFFKAIIYAKLLSFKLQVFDRAGQLVFEATDPGRKWDGLNKGYPYSTSVFVWQCFYQIENKQPEFQKGTVTLIR